MFWASRLGARHNRVVKPLSESVWRVLLAGLLSTPLTAPVLLTGCSESPTPRGESSPRAEPPPEPTVAATAVETEPEPPEPGPERDPDELVIFAGGDVDLGRVVGQRLLKNPNYDPLARLKPLLESADFRMVNLESQLSDQGGETVSRKNPLIFTGPPAGADVLARSNIQLVSLANNHAWDYGEGAFKQTLGNLRRANVAFAGASDVPNTQYRPTTIEVSGFKIAVFAVTHIWNQGPFNEHRGRYFVAWANYPALIKRVARAKKTHDIVLLNYHGDAEYLEKPMEWTRVFLRAASKLGFDAIIGHHPHVPHGVGWRAGAPVFYSLGNLVFREYGGIKWTQHSFAARLTFRRAEGGVALATTEACPYVIEDYEPRSMAAEDVSSLRQHLLKLSKHVGGSNVGEANARGCMPLTPPSR